MLKKKQFAHSGLRKLALKGETEGVPLGAADRARRVLAALAIAEDPSELDFPGQDFRSDGKKSAGYSVALSSSARISFSWDKAGGLADINLETG
jgi:plasmid maintenance system killer protein